MRLCTCPDGRHLSKELTRRGESRNPSWERMWEDVYRVGELLRPYLPPTYPGSVSVGGLDQTRGVD